MFENLKKFVSGNWIKKKKPNTKTDEQKSRFSYFLDDVSKKDPMHAPISLAVSLAEEAMKIVSNRLMLVRQVQNVNEKILELECFAQLTEEEAVHLKHLLDLFISLAKDRNVLRYQLTGFDRSLENMMGLEDDANFALSHIQEAERKQRIFRHDLGHLHGEKADLQYEREQLQTGLDFVNRFAIVMTFIFGSATLFLGYLSMIQNSQVFFAVFILVILLIFVVALIYSFRSRISYELALNIKKQRRAVEFINKKSALYAHYTNFLSYEYKKYNIRNSKMLENNLKEFGHYKHVTSRVDSIRNIMYETEDRLEEFMREKEININRFDIEKFAKTVNVTDKLESHQLFLKEKSELEERLLNLEARHEEISQLFEDLKEIDVTEGKIIEDIVQTYLEEAARMLHMMEKRDIEEEDSDDSDDDLNSDARDIAFAKNQTQTA